ncbi:hypothetical protein CsatB_016822 [Cannabis sativa]|uniref:B-like cyclin n=1 Tax=Cannabis sativa TaxID=3483 RepID=A0A7J6FK32_CANSA|nr:cyclin-A3-4-like isoform X2 [Cannabis sativa]XP_060967710.1 cyclin-A3-4-like isoform X2 [Cannabis sativa]KAF4370987.1 hypothetical protein F8388_002880 [Cannabis sativa]
MSGIDSQEPKKIKIKEAPTTATATSTTTSGAGKEEKTDHKEKDNKLDPETTSSGDGDPQRLPFVSEFYAYLREMEVDPKRRPLPDYMRRVQNDNITPNMRAILVDWLVEVANGFDLTSLETLFVTVSYIDKFLSIKILNRKKLQLLGVSSIIIASKYNDEIIPPHVQDMCRATDHAYTVEEIVKMEAEIRKTLELDNELRSGHPTLITFIRRFMSVDEESLEDKPKYEFLCVYLSKLALLDYDCTVKFLPSLVAASVIFLARLIVKPQAHPWTLSLQKYSRYKPPELQQCVVSLRNVYLGIKWKSLVAIREEYKQSAEDVSTVAEIPAHYFGDIIIS